jgi:hypothetical protein
MSSVEARRNCFVSIPQIVACVAHALPSYLTAAQTVDMLDALLAGLEDYTADERGDVGSWVRIACIHGLTSFSTSMFAHAAAITDFETYFSPARYHAAVAGILKQGVERLDNVRQQAGEAIGTLLAATVPAAQWRVHGYTLLREQFIE